MEMGDIIPDPVESDTVVQIFQWYRSGSSYREIVARLSENGVHYDGDKFWNKNMVARILNDDRYAGAAGYPQLLPSQWLTTVVELRQGRFTSCRLTPVQRELRRLCCDSTPVDIEGRVLTMVNYLIHHPDIVQLTKTIPKQPAELNDCVRSLEKELANTPIDEASAVACAMKMAALKFDQIASEDYETYRLQKRFANMSPLSQLDIDLPRGCVRSITVRGDGSLQLHLTNHQTVLEGEIT